MTDSIIYGLEYISYEIFFVSRKTMEIAVHPDKRIVVMAPKHTALADIKDRVKRRARWIKKQINYFRQFDPRTPPRSYVNGESHLYLGKHYRLRIDKAKEPCVKLVRGKLFVYLEGDASEDTVKCYLESWYKERAKVKLTESFERCLVKFTRKGFKRPVLQFRAMKTRWGSLSKKGTLTLNPVLIRAPKECIEYVITHELCHLKYHDHSPAFYKLLERVMPDWEKRKHRLELALV